MGLVGSAMSFLTSLPVESDAEELRRNLWFMPFAGLVIGGIIAVPIIAGQYLRFNAGLVGLIVYVVVEGSKNLHGLGKFGDVVFSLPDRKMDIMKETNLSPGGIAVVTLYLLVLFFTFFQAEFADIIIGQFLSKYAMLYLLVTSKASWDGVGFYMMRYAKTGDFIPGLFVLVPLLLVFQKDMLIALIAVFIVTYLVRKYSEKVLGGINGSVLGAVNCITFAAILTLLAGIPPSISFPQS